jgi:tRNA pseudouridine38-40 synthase
MPAGWRGERVVRTLRLTLAYEGTDLHGWQTQPGIVTVQGLVSLACARILGEPGRVVGASRTDAGVHALRQVASLTTSSTLPPATLARALNALLPAAIRVVDASEATPGFDARRSARGKRYAYRLDNGPVADPFLRRFAWHLSRPLDWVAVARALPLLRGHHDFSTFCAAPGRGRTPWCTIRSARLVRGRHQAAIMLSADSFLHHMVRNIVGSLVEVGRGAHEPAWIGRLLEAGDRSQAGPTAPAHGLVLVRVLY